MGLSGLNEKLEAGEMVKKTGLTLFSTSVAVAAINIWFWIDSGNLASMFAIGFSSALAMVAVIAFYLDNEGGKQ